MMENPNCTFKPWRPEAGAKRLLKDQQDDAGRANSLGNIGCLVINNKEHYTRF
jgi:hypothetical protein